MRLTDATSIQLPQLAQTLISLPQCTASQSIPNQSVILINALPSFSFPLNEIHLHADAHLNSEKLNQFPGITPVHWSLKTRCKLDNKCFEIM